MSVPLFTVVFPDGSTQYQTGSRALEVGDVVPHHGVDLVVATIGHDRNGAPRVTLRHPDPALQLEGTL